MAPSQYGEENRMLKCALALILLSSAVSAIAQQEATPGLQEGPLTVKPGARPTQDAQQVPPSNSQSAPPKPFDDGSYPQGPGITSPKITNAVAAVYPGETGSESGLIATTISLIVGADGVPVKMHVVHSGSEACDSAAMEAVRQSTFEPGLLDGKPVPVRAVVRVAFWADKRPAVPKVLRVRYELSGHSQQYDQPPALTRNVPAQFSEEARARKIGGTVLISLTVSEDGLPTDLKVVKPLGAGLDEKALESVSQYRFRPAMKDGKPVAAQISVQVMFRLY
jgi:TonB family protein